MKILLVSKGDARNIRTWSGVPNGVLKAFWQRGDEVILCNVFNNLGFHVLGAVWNRFITKFIPAWHRVPFEATRLGGSQMHRCVSHMIRESKPDMVVALTFALENTGFKIPVVLAHDWTFAYAIQYLHGQRQGLTVSEKEAEKQLVGCMRTASRVLAMYPASAAYLKQEYGINNLSSIHLPVQCPDETMGRQNTADTVRHLVVFGSDWHRENVDVAKVAIDALSDKKIVLDIIGLFGVSSETIRYHGYLDKSKPTDRELYWRLLYQASGVIAAGRTWPGGSSIAEAMACGVPIIMGDWPDITGLWGDVETYGVRCEAGDPLSAAHAVRMLLNMDPLKYDELKQRARTLVRDATFTKFADVIVQAAGIGKE